MTDRTGRLRGTHRHSALGRRGAGVRRRWPSGSRPPQTYRPATTCRRSRCSVSGDSCCSSPAALSPRSECVSPDRHCVCGSAVHRFGERSGLDRRRSEPGAHDVRALWRCRCRSNIGAVGNSRRCLGGRCLRVGDGRPSAHSHRDSPGTCRPTDRQRDLGGFRLPCLSGRDTAVRVPKNLHRANAVSRMGSNTIATAGAAVGGIIIAVVGPGGHHRRCCDLCGCSGILRLSPLASSLE